MIGGLDGNEEVLADLTGDLEALAEISRAKFGAVVRAFVYSPQLASPALWVMPLDLAELRGMVVVAVIDAMWDREIVEDIAGLMPAVEHVQGSGRRAKLLGSEDLEARALLWGLAGGWAIAVQTGDADV
jgi:hypothetical protein